MREFKKLLKKKYRISNSLEIFLVRKREWSLNGFMVAFARRIFYKIVQFILCEVNG